MIDALSKLEGVVLATGGGAVMDPENRSCLGGRGYVIYLYTSVDQQVSRTTKGRTRPLIENEDPSGARSSDCLRLRDPMYREIADLVVETDNRKVHAVANEIIEQFS